MAAFSRLPRLALPFCLLFAGALIAGCETPSGAGLELVGEDGGVPQRQDFAPSTIAIVDTIPDITGGLARQSQSRILVGRADDPVFGMIEATGYMGFARPDPSQIPAEFFNEDITGAVLRLRVNYRYGLEDAPVQVDLFEVAEPWIAVGATSDQSFPPGQFVTSFTIAPGDTLIDVQFPAAYVASRDEIFRSLRFNADFHGYMLRPSGAAGAVVGFHALFSSLRLATPSDTLAYITRELFTNINRPAAGTLPDGRLALVDGAPNQIAFTLDPPDVGRVPLANVTLRLGVDAAYEPTAGFIRGMPQQLELAAIDETDNVRRVVAVASFDSQRGQYSFASPTFTELVQNLIFGETRYRNFFIQIPAMPASVDVLVLDPPDADGAPPLRLSLVIIPQRS